MLDQSTLCAISTFPGSGAIAVIRLSGREAIAITDKIFESPKKDKTLIEQKANTLHFGRIVFNKEIIDEVVVSFFKAPHWFTGEDIVEIACHRNFYNNFLKYFLSINYFY